MKFFFAGHTTFGNRGCEALIRSTVGLIRSRQSDARFVVPSSAIALDRQQWPQAESQGVEFIEAPTFPVSIKWWNRASRVLPVVERTLVPHHRLPDQAREALAGCDAMIMSGGDVISLDYGLASLYDWTGYSENAIELGKPVCLWAASVGPFSSKPFVESFIAKHLTRYSALSVRESATLGYLQGMGLQPDLVADPAFTMTPEAFDNTPLMPDGSEGCLGLNVSPLVRGYRSTESSKLALDAELMQFVEHIVNTTDLGVLLIPHVGPLNGGSTNSDHHYMESLLKKSGLVNSSRVKLAPGHLNAAQLKHLISTCRYFVGARTHATIAAFSTGVPTISIAYSVKAKGINNDLFGDTRFVLDTPAVSKISLLESFARLCEEEAGIRKFLPARIERVKKKSAAACDSLFRIFDRRSGI